jgi:hypothetical protein
MGNQQNQNPNFGSEQGRKDEDKGQNERAGQPREQDQPGKGPGGQSGDRDRASNPQGESDQQRNQQPKPGQPNQQNLDR